MTENVTLRKGTWFYFSTETETKLAEIVDYQVDDERSDLHWFKCIMKYDARAEESMDSEKVYSSRNFEQFRSLDLFDEERGREILRDFEQRDQRRREHQRQEQQEREEGEESDIEETSDREGRNIAEVLEDLVSETRRNRTTEARPRPARTRPARARPATQPTYAEPNDINIPQTGEASAPEREYQPRSVFPTEAARANIRGKNFKVPVGSGDMKSVIKLYEADNELSREAIDNIVNETGHLLLTHTGHDTRQKIINQKLDFLAKHKWMDLVINEMYQLEYNDKITIAIYLGKQHWAMHPSLKNEISELTGKTFVLIEDQIIKNMIIEEYSKISDDEMYHSIKNTFVEINPEEIQYLSEDRNSTIYCKSRTESEAISKRDVSKNWEKALVYNYYLGESLDSRLDIKAFKDAKAIEKLAKVRDDTKVLAALV